jgi:DNA-binding NarL/FixJ family response regulator
MSADKKPAAKKSVGDKNSITVKSPNGKETQQQLQLTTRELEILTLIADGYTNKKIADKLNLSTNTIKTHRQRLLSKTGTHNTAELLKAAFFMKFS